MCGGSSEPTNPADIIAAQQRANTQGLQEASKYNTIDQYSPFGSTTYMRNPDGTPYGQNVQYSPELMKYINDTFGTAEASGDYTRRQYGAGTDYLNQVYPASLNTDLRSQEIQGQRYNAAEGIMGRLPQTGVTAGDTSAIANTSYNQAMAKMAPQIAAEQTRLSQSLQDRGLPVGSEIYNNEMTRLNQNTNDLMSSAARQAELDAGTEQSRQVAMNTSLQMLPYNELAAVGAGQYTAQNPNVGQSTPSYTAPTALQTPMYQPQSTNVSGIYNSYDKANADQNAGTMSGLFGIGKAVMPYAVTALSDENMKEDRTPADGEYVLSQIRDMPVDNYRYKDEAQKVYGVPERRTGPMAQDWQRAFPESSDGHMIDLAGMAGRLTAAVKALEQRTHTRGA